MAKGGRTVIKTQKLEKKIKRFADKKGLVYSIARNADNTVEIRIEPRAAYTQVQGFAQ